MQASKPKVFYHIGLHKTATTLLQETYFPQLPITFIKGTVPYTRVIRELESGGVVLFSDENLSGRLFCGNKFSDFERALSSIKRIHPDAGIIIGFRQHADFLLSAYKQHLHEGGTLEQRKFFNANDTGLLKARDLRFSNYLSLVREHFSWMLVYTLEEVGRMHEFDRRFSSFLGIEPGSAREEERHANVGVRTKLQVHSLRLLNRVNAVVKRGIGVDVLYSKPMKYMRVTPRHICQYRLPHVGAPYLLDPQLRDFISKEFKEDWNLVLDAKSHAA